MRLLTLCTLGTSKEPVSYMTIASSLQISKDDVDSWVIRAVGLKLIDAHVDQLAETVSFSRTMRRVFTANDWQELNERFNGWKAGVGSILIALQQGKTQQGK